LDAEPASGPPQAWTNGARKYLSLTARYRSHWEHAAALLAYLILSVAFTWPLMSRLRTAILGMGDARHFVWMLWHTQQAVLGQEGLFHTNLLYYPYGTTLLVNALGPLTGILALPLWVLGPEAVYNLSLLIGFGLTGYCMYLLARELGLPPGPAFFAGIFYLSSPMHVAGLLGHLQKAFLGLLPLVLLGAHRLFDQRRSRWWSLGVALLLLLTLLHTAEQFIYAAMAIGIFLVIAWLEGDKPERREIVVRAVLLGGWALVLNGPLLLALYRASVNPQIVANNNLEAFQHQPDLVQFFLPGHYARFLGPSFASIVRPLSAAEVETSVFVGWTALILCLLAVLGRGKAARRWLLLTLASILIALGPTLRVGGEELFTEYNLPIVLPFAFITALPGFDFWRTPGRFMFIGFIGVAIVASYGLVWLRRRLPGGRWGQLLVLVASSLVILETLPHPWPQEALPPTPAFYREIARDSEQYGVLDLPIRPFQEITYKAWYVYFSSYYQIHQMTHGKGIAVGYVDRPYKIHPLFGHFISDSTSSSPQLQAFTVDGEPADCYANVQYELARHGYRYVVWHKPQSGYQGYGEGSWGEEAAEQFVKAVFGEQPPLTEDDLVRVYAVGPLPDVADLTTTIAPRGSTFQNSSEAETQITWAFSPASLYLASPRSTLAYLEVTPIAIHDPRTGGYLESATLTVTSSGGITTTAALTGGQTSRLPLLMSAGSEVITLTLRSPDAPPSEDAWLNFAFSAVNLQTTSAILPDIVVDGQPQQGDNRRLVALHGPGWYEAEAPAWRWAQSPAELLVYSDSPRTARMQISLGALYDPGAGDGLGDEGVMHIQSNDVALEPTIVRTGQAVVLEVPLQQGWNSIVLGLENGNFRPCDVQPGNGDRRQLSFAVTQIGFDVREDSP
jgi:hypothetical protein